MFSDLISRLEEATGPDVNLDRDIRAAVGLVWREDFYFWGGKRYRGQVNFTESVDAALLLVPEGMDVYLGTDGPWATVWSEGDDPFCRGRGKTLPLSLCIAVLRARGS